MALKGDRRRIGAASATVSAGALVFFAAGTGPASADTPTTAGTECKLGKLLCGILGAGKGTSAPSPKPSGGTSTKPSSKPAPHPKPKAPAKPRPHSPAAGTDPAAPAAPGAPLPTDGDTTVPLPDSSGQTPALPDVTSEDPLVFPEPPPDSAQQVQPVAATSPDEGPVPPLLVATASGLIGAVAALNLSVASHRRRARRGR